MIRQRPAFLVLLSAAVSFGGAFAMHEEGQRSCQELQVNSGVVDPAVPLDLSMKVHLFARDRRLEIATTVRKHPAYPAELFFDWDVHAEIRLPAGLRLQAGALGWSGDLRGDEVAEFVAEVTVPEDTEGTVTASVIGHAAGGRVDADTEQFYVSASGGTIRISRDVPRNTDQTKPATGAVVK